MARDFLDVLNAAADAAVAALAGCTDWGPTGRKEGQYGFDLAADEAATAVLRDGGLRVLSEESGLGAGDGPVAVLDPVDGSTNASRGIRYFATSVCVVDDTVPVAAVVHDHGSGERFEAVRGGGARLDGTLLDPRRERPLHSAVVAVNGQAPGWGGWAQVRTLGAAALELCAVADGRLDGYIDFSKDGLGSWDYLGGLLVCREVGVGVVDGVGRQLVTIDHARTARACSRTTAAADGPDGRLRPADRDRPRARTVVNPRGVHPAEQDQSIENGGYSSVSNIE